MFQIYLVTDKTNGKGYVGKTSQTIEKRWKQHQYTAHYKDTYFGRVIKKRLPSDFELMRLDCTENEREANELEKLYIGIFKTSNGHFGYNTALGGVGCLPNEFTLEKMKANAPWKGKKRSIEFGANISRKLKGVPKSSEHRKNIGLANKGKIVSVETRQKIREAGLGRTFSLDSRNKIKRFGSENHFYGRTHSDESKNKISSANKGKPRSTAAKSEPHKIKIREALLGRFVGELNPNFGKKHSPETKAKMKAYWAKRRTEKQANTN